MSTQNPDRRLPAGIAWPLIVVNVLIVMLSVFNLVDHFRSPWSTWLTLALGAVDLGLALAVFSWLRRRSA